MLFFQRRAQDEISIFNAGMIALQINRAGPVHFRPESATRRAQYGLVIDDLCAVQNDRGITVKKDEIMAVYHMLIIYGIMSNVNLF